jgi:hypothetical protein
MLSDCHPVTGVIARRAMSWCGNPPGRVRYNRGMRMMHLRLCETVIGLTVFIVPALAQRSHWAAADDKTAQYIIDMERKWAEGVCGDNGVVAELLADDFQGTSTTGARYRKADELRDEKGPHTARDCGIDEVKVRFFGDSLALVYGSEHAVGKDKSQPNAKVCQVWTDTWLKRGGKWQIVAAQDNRVACR